MLGMIAVQIVVTVTKAAEGVLGLDVIATAVDVVGNTVVVVWMATAVEVLRAVCCWNCCEGCLNSYDDHVVHRINRDQRVGFRLSRAHEVHMDCRVHITDCTPPELDRTAAIDCCITR